MERSILKEGLKKGEIFEIAWQGFFRPTKGNVGLLLLNFRPTNISVNIGLKYSRRQVWTVTTKSLDSKKISVNGQLLRRGFYLNFRLWLAERPNESAT